MLGKLTQLKNFITHAVTSLNSQRPLPPNDPALDDKLKFMLDYIMRNEADAQFRAYHSLQTPEMRLNQLLSQIYHSSAASTDQISSILHFYTFLLLNCGNELVLCKIVSDPFVLELTEVDLDALGRNVVNSNIDIEEINSYKIALIKAYVSKINHETIKYMITNERMKVFENCIHLYESFMDRQEKQFFGVESTCISNCILMIIRFIAANPELSPNICYEEGQKGVTYLLVKIVEKIHKSMLVILNSSQLEEQLLDFLRDRILFLVDMVNSISSPDYREKIIVQTSKYLADLRQLFKEIVLYHTVALNQMQQNYLKSLELIKVLLKLLVIYFNAEKLLPTFEQCLLPIIQKFAHLFKSGCNQLKEQQRKSGKKIHQNEYNMQPNAMANKFVSIFCSNMEILVSIIKSGDYLNRRNCSSPKEKQLKTIMINTLIDIIQLLVGEEGQPIRHLLCFRSVKFLLFSLMQLTVQNDHTLHEYSVLKFHQFTIQMFRKHLKNNENWDYLVLHYEYLLKSVSSNLINIQEANPQEYNFCQFHDTAKLKMPTENDSLVNSIIISECARNFRFMIVEKTGVNIKDIKLQKNYHSNFTSPGWDYQPGKEITNPVSEICELNHFSNGFKIPIMVIGDKECLLFAHREGEKLKTIANIRYKMIEGFTTEKEVIHIRLKGLQQVLVEPPQKNPKNNITRFKEYLIDMRDKSRQRELKFVNHYLNNFYEDNLKLIQEMGQAEIISEEIPSTIEEVLVAKEENQPIALTAATEPYANEQSNSCQSLQGKSSEQLE